jgi:hypothetical protein
MADQPSLQIDNDWKKQAQEEKRKLAEQQAAKAAPTTAAAPPPRSSAAAPGDPRAARELPQANLASIVQSMVTQALFHLGDLAPRGGEPTINLDLAKHHIDSLAVLEEKTANNLTPEEKQMLDSALYETRMRYINVASQYIS